jgi:hypothetical protein
MAPRSKTLQVVETPNRLFSTSHDAAPGPNAIGMTTDRRDENAASSCEPSAC